MTQRRPTVEISAALDAPHLPATHRLLPILDAYARRRGAVSPALPGDTPWGPTFFGLERVTLYMDAPVAVQAAVLDDCAQALLGEAYAIEKAGMAYCARQCLEARSTQERMFFSHMGADEATHLYWLVPYVRGPAVGAADPFLCLLSEAVESAPRPTLVYLMQIVLEGWGLTHYRHLADGCRAPDLGERLRRILRDEAAHYGGGRLLFDAAALDDAGRRYIVETLAALLQMVQVGPQAVVTALDRARGGLSMAQTEQVFDALATQRTSAERLDLLRGLMIGHGVDPLIARLESLGSFQPSGPSVCAAVLRRSHSA